MHLILAAAKDQGLISFLNGKVGSVQNLLQASMVVIGIGFIAFTWIKTKAFAATMGAILMAGVAIFAAYSPDFFAKSICNEQSTTTCSIHTTTNNGNVAP